MHVAFRARSPPRARSPLPVCLSVCPSERTDGDGRFIHLGPEYPFIRFILIQVRGFSLFTLLAFLEERLVLSKADGGQILRGTAERERESRRSLSR